MSITPLKFTGVSTFSTDLQTILTRAVAIASIPVQQLQTQQSDLISKKQTLGTISAKVQALATAVQNLGDIGAKQSVSAFSSNSNRVSVNLNGSPTPGIYSITNITSLAKAASENTATGYASATATPVDTNDDIVQLAFGSNTYQLDLSTYGNNLNGLRDAINGLGVGLTATVLDSGNATDPYYLSVTAASPGETTLQIRTTEDDAQTNILTANNQGSDAHFQFGNLDITRKDNVVTDLIPGLTFTLLSPTDTNETVTLNVSSNRGTLATGLQNLVTAYNDVSSTIQQQIGENAGLLSGDFLVRQVQTTLRNLAGYQNQDGTGSVTSLAALGIELDKNGVMSFDSASFYALPTATFNDSLTFLGSQTTGFGGLSQSLTQISDPITGLIKTQQDSYDASDQRISNTIDQINTRIQNMQTALSAQLQQADALLSTLESQQNLLTGSLDSVNLALYGKKN